MIEGGGVHGVNSGGWGGAPAGGGFWLHREITV